MLDHEDIKRYGNPGNSDHDIPGLDRNQHQGIRPKQVEKISAIPPDKGQRSPTVEEDQLMNMMPTVFRYS
jgi:hypothetical protein